MWLAIREQIIPSRVPVVDVHRLLELLDVPRNVLELDKEMPFAPF